MSSVTVRWTGVAELTKKMIGSANGVNSASAKAVRQTTNDVYDTSQVLVPVRTGALKASATQSTRRTGFRRYTGTVSYGGGPVDYAVYVHEILDHKHMPPTSAKFLELALLMVQPKVPMTFKEHVGGALARSFRR